MTWKQNIASFFLPFLHVEMLRSELHDDDDNCKNYFFTSLFLSADVVQCCFVFFLGKADVRINKSSSQLLRYRGIKVSSPEGMDSVDESAEGDGMTRWDWPRELITRPICAKSRRVIAR